MGRLLDAEDRTALADMVTLFALVAIAVVAASVVAGEAVHLFRVVAGV